MSDSKDKRTTGCIIVGASCYADATPALNLAAMLAPLTKADIRGILVEEDQLLSIAQFPTSRIVSPAGERIVTPSLQQMLTVLAGDARAFEEAIANLAHASFRSWTFERFKGEMLSHLRATTGSHDILLIGHQTVHQYIGDVVLIHQPGRDYKAAFSLARHLSNDLKKPLFIAAIATDQHEHSAAIREQREMLQDAHQRGSSGEVFDTKSDLLKRLSHFNAATVVIDIDAGPFQTNEELQGFLDRARCPVVVVGAHAGSHTLEYSTVIPEVH